MIYLLALNTKHQDFGPGSGGVGTFQFYTGAYYNQTNREHGIILPVGLQESPPISVEDKISRQQLLNIEIESPFSEIRPINITVDDQDYPTINKRRLQLPSDSFPIINGLGKVDKIIIDACPNLKMVHQIGTGIDNVDVDYCTSKSVYVS